MVCLRMFFCICRFFKGEILYQSTETYDISVGIFYVTISYVIHSSCPFQGIVSLWLFCPVSVSCSLYAFYSVPAPANTSKIKPDMPLVGRYVCRLGGLSPGYV